MLLSFGIQTKRAKTNREGYTVVVYTEFLKKFIEEIGFAGEKKQRLIQENQEIINFPVRVSHRVIEVESVEDGEIINPLAVTVEGGLNVTNGIITHNTDVIAASPEYLRLAKVMGLVS